MPTSSVRRRRSTFLQNYLGLNRSNHPSNDQISNTLNTNLGLPSISDFTVANAFEALEQRMLMSVVISEFVADNNNTLDDEDGSSSDWIELFNPDDTPADLSNFYLTDNASDLTKWQIPVGVTLDPGQFLVIFASEKNRAVAGSELHTNFKLSAGGEYLGLIDPDGSTVVHEYAPEFPQQFEDVGYGLAMGQSETIILDQGVPARAHIPTSGALGLSWTQTNFTPDASWLSGTTGVGYDYSGLIGLDVGAMRNVNQSVYARVEFNITNPNEFSGLLLRMKYEDGFIAYLNGEKIAAQNDPDSPQWNSGATSLNDDSDAVVFEEFEVSQFLHLLQPGTNVLAFHGLNASLNSSDILILPQLVGTQVANFDPNDPGYLEVATPNGPNVDTSPGFVSDVQLSVDHGFYDAPFQLEVTTTELDAQIRYTTDGSDPTETSTLYTGPITISQTTAFRARAFKGDLTPSTIKTATYLFTSDIVNQSPTGAPPAGFPFGWGGNTVDYGMDPDIVNSPTWGPQMHDALTSIPSFSVVTDEDNLFDASTGIYANAGNRGRAWERPTSLELIDPNGNEEGFTIDAGIRIRGGFSRSGNNPKHAFRLFFRSEYGEGKLDYPLFGDEGVDKFDGFDLRTTQNYSWSFQNSDRNTFLRDVFSRDVMRDINNPYTRSRYYHLYINGHYWGLFQTEERPEADFASSYFGGEPEDYDVVKPTPGKDIEATDGNLDAYNRLYDEFIAGDLDNNEKYYRLQGLNPDGTRNENYERYLDVQNIMDYMIVTYYTADADGPGSRFTRPGPNNFFGIYNRENPDGFKFFEHDSEHSLDTGNAAGANFNMVTPLLSNHGGAGNREHFNPHWMHEQLILNNLEYRTEFADRTYRHFFNDGPLTAQHARAFLQARAAQIDSAIIAESARWGDAKRSTPFTKDTWLNAINNTYNFTNTRVNTVLGQLRSQGWYPDVAGLTFQINGSDQYGGDIDLGDTLAISGGGGATIYFTTDGADPRLPGGGINPAARIYDQSFELNSSVNVFARAFTGSEWSPLASALFLAGDVPPLRITELNFNPAPPNDPSPFLATDFEYIEIQNTGDEPVNLSSIKIVNGVEFAFPSNNAQTLAAGSFSSGPGAFTFLDDAINGTSNPAFATGNHDGAGGVGGGGTTVRFDGSDNRIDVGNASDLNFDTSDPFTLSAWIRTDATSGEIMQKSEPTGTSRRGYRLGINALGQLDFWLNHNLISERMFVKSVTGGINDNQWHHVMVTYDGTGSLSSINMFIDGVDAGTTVSGSAGGITNSIQTTEPFTIGSRGSTLGYFDGSIDDPAVFNAALTSSDAADLFGASNYANAVNALNPVAYWQLSDPSGPTAVDETGNNPGTYINFDPTDFNKSGPNSDGGLHVQLGPGATNSPSSGAWTKSFNLNATAEVHISFDYRLLLADSLDADDFAEVHVLLDGQPLGSDINNAVLHLTGNDPTDSGWQTFNLQLSIDPGEHTLAFGVYSNKLDAADESVDLFIDNVEAVTVPQETSLQPGEFGLLVRNAAAFQTRYDTSNMRILGEFTGALKNSGERIELIDPFGQVIHDFDYEGDWYDSTAGQGYSLAVRDPNQPLELWTKKIGWKPSGLPNGSPGAADTGLNPESIVINEISAHTDDLAGDKIELHNTTDQPIDVTGWFLSDDKDDLTKYQIPTTPPIPAGGFLVLTQVDHFGSAFALSELGETLHFSSSDQSGGLGGLRESQSFRASEVGDSFTRYITSEGDVRFPIASVPTFGSQNANPRVGPIAITEIMYNPADPADVEFIELLNTSSTSVPLFDPANPANTWRFTDGIDFTFPANQTIQPAERFLVVPIEPSVFRAQYNIDPAVKIYGPYTGALSNNGEDLELSRPTKPEPDSFIPMILVDQVRYNDTAPWAELADGQGHSLNRINPHAYANDVINWTSGIPGGTPGEDDPTIDTVAPVVQITNVSPDPRNTLVDSINIFFTEPVNGFTIDDLTLTLNDGSNLLTGAQSLTTTDNITFTLSGLSSITSTDGAYTLSLDASASNITDNASNTLVQDASESWTLTTGSPEVDVYLVPRIAPSSNHTSITLPTSDNDPATGAGNFGPNQFYQREQNNFLTEIWIKSDQFPVAIESGQVSLQFNSLYVTPIAIQHGDIFNNATSQFIDAVNGTLFFGGSTSQNDLGDNEFVMLGRVLFQSDAPIDPTTLGAAQLRPFNAQIQFADTGNAFTLIDSSPADADTQAPLQIDIRPVIYDFDNNNIVNFSDLGLFLPARGEIVGGSVPPYTTWADFNGDNEVDAVDLNLLLSAFGKSFSDPSINYSPSGLSEQSSFGGAGASGASGGVDGFFVDLLSEAQSDADDDSASASTSSSTTPTINTLGIAKAINA